MTGAEVELAVEQRSPLAAWVDDFGRLAQVAGQLAQTAFIPASLRVFRDNGRTFDAEATASQVTAAILTGQELGLDRIASLSSIDVVQGRPALRAIALRGILQAHGHEIWVEDATNSRATVAGHRRGSSHVQRITWTMDDARARGLAGKSNWRSQPRNMLIARATSEVARLVAADALLGVPYTAEELEDQGDEIAVQAPAAGPRRARRTTPPLRAIVNRPPVAEQPRAPEDVPALDDEPQAAVTHETPDDAPAVDEAEAERDTGEDVEVDLADIAATPEQLRMMFALMNEQNILERDDRLSFCSLAIEREIESSQDLTVPEASTIINKLQALPSVS